MKLLRILIVFILFPWAALAQQQTEYNRKGDEALKRKDLSQYQINSNKLDN